MAEIQVPKEIDTYVERVIKEFSPKQVILFGSYARGQQHKDSDVDIAVIMENKPSQFMQKATRLFSLCWDIDLDIEPVLFAENDNPSGFLREVKKTGIVLYSQ